MRVLFFCNVSVTDAAEIVSSQGSEMSRTHQPHEQSSRANSLVWVHHFPPQQHLQPCN